MEYQEISVPQFQTLNLAPRSEGLHLSDVLNDIERVLFKDEAERKSNFNNPYWAEIGFLWERLLELAWKDMLGKRPGEVVRDGIICSPDGECVKDGYIEEYKCTWKSTKKKPWEIWRWMVQVKSYCYVMGVNMVMFHVLHVNGDYSFFRGNTDGGPEYKQYMILFTDNELQDNWNMIKDHAEKLRGEYK